MRELCVCIHPQWERERGILGELGDEWWKWFDWGTNQNENEWRNVSKQTNKKVSTYQSDSLEEDILNSGKIELF